MLSRRRSLLRRRRPRGARSSVFGAGRAPQPRDEVRRPGPGTCVRWCSSWLRDSFGGLGLGGKQEDIDGEGRPWPPRQEDGEDEQADVTGDFPWVLRGGVGVEAA